MSGKDKDHTCLGYVEKRMRKTNVNPIVSTDEYYTPRWIIDTLGPFDCDPCAPPKDMRPFDDGTDFPTEVIPMKGRLVVGLEV